MDLVRRFSRHGPAPQVCRRFCRFEPWGGHEGPPLQLRHPSVMPVAFVVVARRGHPTVHFLPLIQLPLPDLQGASVRRLRVAR